MSTTPKEAVIGTIEHSGLPTNWVSVDHAPHPAEVLETGLDHRRHVVSVTEEHGLQVKVIEDDDLRTNPHRAEGTRTVTELPSFLAELARRPLDDVTGTLWGNADRGAVTAIYNDHEGGPNSAELGKDDRAPGWRDDKLVLQLKPDPDWIKWHQLSGKFMRQVEFGDVVEDLLHTVVDPDQADLLEIIDSVRASTKGEFENSVVRANGSQTVQYSTEVTTRAGRTGQLAVPQTIALQLRPWEGHEVTYEISAYFRLRIEGNALQLAIKLKPTRQILRDAWTDVTSKIVETINKPVYSQP